MTLVQMTQRSKLTHSSMARRLKAYLFYATKKHSDLKLCADYPIEYYEKIKHKENFATIKGQYKYIGV
jgi:hypothetical protein